MSTELRGCPKCGLHVERQGDIVQCEPCRRRLQHWSACYFNPSESFEHLLHHDPALWEFRAFGVLLPTEIPWYSAEVSNDFEFAFIERQMG